MIYLFCGLLNYVALFLSKNVERRRFLTVLTLFVFTTFVVLRGRVGPDTAGTYEPMVANLSEAHGTEPLFIALLHVLAPLFPTPLMTVTVGLGLVFNGLLLVYILRATDSELFVIQAFYFPTHYLGASVSGQRNAIAFALLLLGWQCSVRKQTKAAIGWIFLALFTHYSTLLFLTIWWLNSYGLKKRSHWLWLGFGTLASVTLAFIVRDYLLSKFVLYFESSYERPNPWSGISIILVITLLIACGLFAGRLTPSQRKRLLIVNSCVMSLFILIGFYSIGALRLIGIEEASVAYSILAMHQLNGTRLSPSFRRSFACVAALACLLMARNVAQEQTVTPGSSPTLPYRFIWQETVQ